mgnify:CR=1 FL=1
MLYLSWDIGIKNLSYCLLKYNKELDDYKIVSWEIINLVEDNNKKEEKKCIMIQKNGKDCNRKSLFYDKKTERYLCKVHTKQVEEENIVDINNIICSHHKCKKKIVFECCNPMIGYCRVHSKKYMKEGIEMNEIKKINKSELKKNEMNRISSKLINELDSREFLLNADIITIENQPAMKNPKMKSIQMVLYTYFLIRGMIDENRIKKLLFLMASNKLKIEFNKEVKENIIKEIHGKYKDKYRRHKELSKKYCLYYLENIEDKKWLDYFNSHKKKDDLADTFLMNIYQIGIDK